MELKSVGMVINQFSENAVSYSDNTSRILQSKGVRVLSENEMSSGESADLILAFGGDGTILKSAQYAIKRDIPILGLNFGRLGFLAEKVPETPCNLADLLTDGDLPEEERMFLTVEREGCEPMYAVNDAVISRGGYARLISLEVMVNGAPASKMLADGMIIATPTGSTGYSLSAGGPVVSPDVDCMTVTPVCPHSLQLRPLVISGSSEIAVTMGEDPYQAAVLQIDGQNRGIMKQNDRITVRRSEQKIRVLRLERTNYYTLVRTKLSEWGTN